jgi:serine/threonine protein kinase
MINFASATGARGAVNHGAHLAHPFPMPAPIELAQTLDAPSERDPHSAAAASSRDIFAVGEIVSDAYEIRGRLGEGGMGQVFEAHDRVLNRRVAIKAAWRHIDPSSIRNEAQALAALHHPSMVTVYAFGRHQGTEYVVMERIFGESLEAYLARHAARGAPLPLEEALSILIGIADGLVVVHAAGIAHRDVKPSNVMLAPGDRVVLMDFGIFQPEIDRSKKKLVTGSPQYIAPETIENTIASGAAFLVDVYAFGIVLFEVLTGRVPYDSDNVMKILHLHRTAPLPDLAALRADAPPRLSALARDLVAKDPRDRPTNMVAVRGELEAILRRERATRKPVARPKTERLSVLIAEDNPATAEVLRELVASEVPGAEVRMASDGEAALALAQAKVPHLLLLDLTMPRMSGLEVCMCLCASADFERCTLIAISACDDPAEISLLRQLGVSQFIPKGPELAERLPAILDEVRASLATPSGHAPP